MLVFRLVVKHKTHQTGTLDSLYGQAYNVNSTETGALEYVEYETRHDIYLGDHMALAIQVTSDANSILLDPNDPTYS